MDYKSPIEAVYSDLKLRFEDGVYEAVQAVDIHVDRDELIKALQYDRQQYEKGWHDALLKVQEPKQAKKLTFHVKTTLGYEKPIVMTRYDWLCPTCESLLCRDIDVIDDNYHYCKVCGQAVKWDE